LLQAYFLRKSTVKIIKQYKTCVYGKS